MSNDSISKSCQKNKGLLDNLAPDNLAPGQFGTRQFSTKIVKTDTLAPRRKTDNVAPR